MEGYEGVVVVVLCSIDVPPNVNNSSKKKREKSLSDDPKPLVLSHLIIFVIAQLQLRWLPQVCCQG